MNRAWTLAPLLLAALACGDSHTPDDCDGPSVEGGLPACIDACCEVRSTATPMWDEASCGYVCPDGTELLGSSMCTPAPGCGSCGDVDAGPPAPCYGGPCCDDIATATIGPDCSAECPSGYGFTCEVDPSAFCAPDPRACDVPSDCVVTANTCCGECGPATLGGSTAVNEDSLTSFRAELCADDPLCPDCPTAPNPELVATCAADRCEVVDLGMDAMTECTTSDECIVRTVDCCECGGATGPGSLIALNQDARGDYESLVCDPGTGCPECAPVYPSNVSAVCDVDRCILVYEDAP